MDAEALRASVAGCQPHGTQARESGRGATLLVLLLLTLAAPFTLVVTVLCWIRRSPALRPSRPTVVVTGGKMTKALHLARAFHALGHRVVLVESRKYACTAHRWSRAVARFHSVPDPARRPEAFLAAVEAVVREEDAMWVVPVASPVSAAVEARLPGRLPSSCRVVSPSPEDTAWLDDKERLCARASELGLPAPEVFRVTSVEEVLALELERRGGRYIMKSIVYDPVHRLERPVLPFPGMRRWLDGLPISADRPWVVQTYLEGEEVCTHGVAESGRLKAACTCPSSDFQVRYDARAFPKVEAWVQRFVKGTGVSGQISFDFILDADGTPRPIECNPRTHSAVTVFDDPVALARAYLTKHEGLEGALGEAAPVVREGQDILRPRPDTRPTYFLAHELWDLARGRGRLKVGLARIRRGRDAVFTPEDPLPFFFLHHLHIPWLLMRCLRAGRRWVRIDFNIGKLVERGGD